MNIKAGILSIWHRICSALGPILRILALPFIVAAIHGTHMALGYDESQLSGSLTSHLIVGLVAWLVVLYHEDIRRLLRKFKSIEYGGLRLEVAHTPGILTHEGAHRYNDIDEIYGDAKGGRATARNLLGVMLFTGKSIEQDERAAAEWWRMAAEQGLAEAQHNLGWAYYHGEGVKRDLGRATGWWRMAAGQGLAESQLFLGNAADHYGIGVEQDAGKEVAICWWRMAAEQGLAEAQHNLGRAYYIGEGVEQDAAEAARWYRLAAEQGLAEAQNNLGMYHYERCERNADDRDMKKAVHWWRMAAEQGFACGQNNLGWACNEGRGVEQDAAEAARWYRLAAEQGLGGGSAEAQYDLGTLYRDGRGVPQGHREAYIWFAVAAAGGLERAAAERDGMTAKLSPEGLQSAQTEAVQRHNDAACRQEQRLKDRRRQGLCRIYDERQAN